MQPSELKAECVALAETIGPRAHVSASISNNHEDGTLCHLSIWPDGITGKANSLFLRAADWTALFAKARETWAEMSEQFEARRIREMALTIIRKTDELGGCSDAALRADRFTDEDIARYGDAACEKADEMAGNGPFTIKRVGVANGAPDAA